MFAQEGFGGGQEVKDVHDRMRYEDVSSAANSK